MSTFKVYSVNSAVQRGSQAENIQTLISIEPNDIEAK